MRKYTFLIIILLSCEIIYSQTAVNNKILEINNIHLNLQNIGNLKINGVGGGFWMELPNDSTIIYDQGPWIIGKINDEVHIGMVQWWEPYLSSVFSPGPIINGKAAMQYTPEDSIKYRIYKINRADNESNIDYAEWPTNFGAPINSNGKPKLFGDQTLWTAFNSLDSTTISDNNDYGTLPVFPIEIQQLTYAREGNLPDTLDIFSNTVFFEWTIINKGSQQLDSAYFSFWTDIDFYLTNNVYNIPAIDTALDIGYLWSFTTEYEPAVGYILLYGPTIPSNGNSAIFKGRTKTNYKNLTSSANHIFFGGGAGDPKWLPAFSKDEAWNIARGYYPNGTKKIDPTTNKKTNFTLSGDPVTDTGWLYKEYTGGGSGFNMFSGPFTFAPGDTQWVMMALIPSLGNDYAQSIKWMRQKAVILKSLPYDSLAFGSTPLVVSVESEKEKTLPTDFVLYQNYPNPFNPNTIIGYQISETGFVSLKVYDVLGKEVAILANEFKQPGEYRAKFNVETHRGKSLPSGIYFYTLRVSPSANSKLDFTQTKKMLLIK